MIEDQDTKSGKNNALVSYFWLIGVIIAYNSNAITKSQFAFFHIRQSLGLWLSSMALGYTVGHFDNWQITVSFWLTFGVLFIYGFSTALSGKMIPIPLVGKFYQSAFKNIK